MALSDNSLDISASLEKTEGGAGRRSDGGICLHAGGTTRGRHSRRSCTRHDSSAGLPTAIIAASYSGVGGLPRHRPGSA